MDTISLKIIAEEIAEPVNFLINLSIKTSTFPNQWKIGRLIPIFKGKGKDKFSPDSYRPVSLLPALSKVAEKTIQEQLNKHMETEHLWNRDHHAYKRNHSTATALSQLTDIIYEAAEEKQIAVAMSLDESAAFDMISHNMILEKLKLYKCHSTTIAWFQSYLTFRSQYVAIGGHKSNLTPVLGGVPQGSIIGPTLFNVFTNELPDLINDYNVCKDEAHNMSDELFNNNCKKCGCLPTYDDDSVYIVANSSRIWNQQRLEEILERLTKFLNNNRLCINKSKTVLQEFMLKQKRCKVKGEPLNLLTLTDKGDFKRIKVKRSNLFLRGTLQDDLQWKVHLDAGEEPLLADLRKKLGALKYLSGNLPRKIRLILANGIILSKILYILPIYGGTHQKYLSKIQILMNKTIRFVTGFHKRTKSMVLMKEAGWLNIHELVIFPLVIDDMESYETENTEVHGREVKTGRK